MSNVKRTPTGDPVIARIETFMKMRKTTQEELMRHLGINRSNFTMWKYENGKSYMKYIQQIAEFLGVGVLDLLQGNASQNKTLLLTDEREITFLETYRRMDKNQKELLNYLMKAISDDGIIPEEFKKLYETFKRAVKLDGKG